ncbi:MAG TPA: hypothetical protein VGB70_08575 [Allosphingosinicella sp.]|jgi:hypothetical protein
MRHTLELCLPLALGLAAAYPAQAQSVVKPGGILAEIDKRCAEDDAERITVCGRREQQRSPYRLAEPPPRFDAGAGIASTSRDRHSLYEHGDTGIHSCTAVGPGGGTGCTFRKWKESDEQWGGKPRGKRKRPSDFPDD